MGSGTAHQIVPHLVPEMVLQWGLAPYPRWCRTWCRRRCSSGVWHRSPDSAALGAGDSTPVGSGTAHQIVPHLVPEMVLQWGLAPLTRWCPTRCQRRYSWGLWHRTPDGATLGAGEGTPVGSGPPPQMVPHSVPEMVLLWGLAPYPRWCRTWCRRWFSCGVWHRSPDGATLGAGDGTPVGSGTLPQMVPHSVPEMVLLWGLAPYPRWCRTWCQRRYSSGVWHPTPDGAALGAREGTPVGSGTLPQMVPHSVPETVLQWGLAPHGRYEVFYSFII